LSENIFYLDEFIAKEFAAGKIDAGLFTTKAQK
jgi:hypothetical protein